jgi:hypothetical protein
MALNDFQVIPNFYTPQNPIKIANKHCKTNFHLLTLTILANPAVEHPINLSHISIIYLSGMNNLNVNVSITEDNPHNTNIIPRTIAIE